MTKVMLCLICIGLFLSVAISAAADNGGCQKDTDCKGDRVCHQGQCVSPQDAEPAPAPVVQPAPAPVVQPAPAPAPVPAAQPAPVAAPPPLGVQPALPPPSAPPSAPPTGVIAMHRRGLEVEPRFGAAVCIDSGDMDCISGNSGLYPGPGVGLFVGLRPVPFVSVGPDLGYYFYSPQSDGQTAEGVLAGVGNAMVMVRAHLPLQIVDFYAKFGLGYAAYKETMNSGFLQGETKITSPLSFKVGGGANFYFVRARRYGDLGVGFDLDYLIFRPKTLELCLNDSCEETDWEDTMWDDWFDSFQISVHFTWAIPIFGRAQ